MEVRTPVAVWARGGVEAADGGVASSSRSRRASSFSEGGVTGSVLMLLKPAVSLGGAEAV